MKKKRTRPATTAKPAAAKVPSPRSEQPSRKTPKSVASSSGTKSKAKAAKTAKSPAISRRAASAAAQSAAAAPEVGKAPLPAKGTRPPSAKTASAAPSPAPRVRLGPPPKLAADRAGSVLPKTGTSLDASPVPREGKSRKSAKPVQKSTSEPRPRVRVRKAALDKIAADYLEEQLRAAGLQSSPPPSPPPVAKAKNPRKLKTKTAGAEVASESKTARPAAVTLPRTKKVLPQPLRGAAVKAAAKRSKRKRRSEVPAPAAQREELKAGTKPTPAPKMHPVTQPKAPVPKSVLRKLRADPPSNAPAQRTLKARIVKTPAPLPLKGPAARRLAARAAAGRRVKPYQPLETESADQGSSAPELGTEPPVESSAETPAVIRDALSTALTQEPSPSPSAAVAEPRRKSRKLPAYLLEGDELTPLPVHLRAQPQPLPPAAGQAAPVPLTVAPSGAQPKTGEPGPAGTKSTPPLRTELVLTARDPHCLYALWEMDEQHVQMWVSDAADGRLVLRVFRGHTSMQPATEIHLHPGERHCFCHVRDENTRYIATLGYYRWDGSWQEVARSGDAVTPPKAPSVSRTVEFARHDVPVPPPAAPEPASAAAAAPAATHSAPPWVAQPDPGGDASHSINAAPGADASESWPIHTIPESAPPVLHPSQPHPEEEDTHYTDPAREHQMIELLRTFSIITEPADSLVISRSVEERAFQEIVSQAAGAPITGGLPPPVSSFSLPVALPSGEEAIPVEVSSVSQALAGAVPGPEFWFKVNTEIVVYGSTVPTARVLIGNRPIRLRPDGTFSFRFSLPDGQHTLPVVATAVHGDERAAQLEFTRRTELSGSVGTHPQDPALKPPSPDNVS